MSTDGGVPSPIRSPLKSIGASSFSPSPITTTPSMVDAVKHVAHRVDCRCVGGLLVAAADQPRGAERRRLGDAHKLEREVAVRSGVGGAIAHRATPAPGSGKPNGPRRVSFTGEPHGG